CSQLIRCHPPDKGDIVAAPRVEGDWWEARQPARVPRSGSWGTRVSGRLGGLAWLAHPQLAVLRHLLELVNEHVHGLGIQVRELLPELLVGVALRVLAVGLETLQLGL